MQTKLIISIVLLLLYPLLSRWTASMKTEINSTKDYSVKYIIASVIELLCWFIPVMSHQSIVAYYLNESAALPVLIFIVGYIWIIRWYFHRKRFFSF